MVVRKNLYGLVMLVIVYTLMPLNSDVSPYYDTLEMMHWYSGSQYHLISISYTCACILHCWYFVAVNISCHIRSDIIHCKSFKIDMVFADRSVTTKLFQWNSLCNRPWPCSNHKFFPGNWLVLQLRNFSTLNDLQIQLHNYQCIAYRLLWVPH